MAFVGRGINTVRTTGNQSVAGNKTFTGNSTFTGSALFSETIGLITNNTNSGLSVQKSNITKGTIPTEGTNARYCMQSKDGTTVEYRIASFELTYNTSGTSSAVMSAFEPVNGSTTRATIGVYYPTGNSPYTAAPTPTDTTTTSGSQIATTGWVNSTGNNVVHITKSETITGSKTFTSPILTVSDSGTMFNMQCSDINCTNYVTSTANKYCGFFDVNNVLLSGLQLHYTASESTIRLQLRKQTDTTTSAASLSYLGLKFATTGNAYGLAPDFLPISDNTYTLGNGSYRWKQLFAGTATISTSDERCKQGIENVPDTVLDAWGEVGFYQFKFNDSVAEKGDAARLHTGMIAQRIMQIFGEHGLNAAAYGLFCYDEWEAEPAELDDGNIITPAKEAGNRYSLRYEECLCMEAAFQRRRADRIEARLSALEARLNNENQKLDSGEN